MNPITEQCQAIESALVKAMKARSGAHVFCEAGTWWIAFYSSEDGTDRACVSLTDLARDLERELS
jgi:hypothetical protein